MTTRTPHADFTQAPRAHQWQSGTLEALLTQLRFEAYRLQGRPAWRILPGGALVSLRIQPETFRAELRIARSSAPVDDAAAAAWAREVDTFLAHFDGAAAWEPTDSAAPDQGVARTFVYRYRGERQHPPPRCARCDAAVPDDKGLYAETLCTSCAMQAGREETRATRSAQ